MKRLSRQDIELIAARVVNAYINMQKLEGATVYSIDPVKLSENLLRLKVDYQHLSLDNSILGLTSYQEMGIEVFENDDSDVIYYLDGKTLLIESNLKYDVSMNGRCNFTIVHEASHQILRMLYPKEYGSRNNNQIHFYRTTSDKKRKITDWEEWQANTLGSAILLPPNLIKQAMFIFSLGDKIEILNKIYAPTVYERFSEMARFLGSSKTALAIRMKYLGLLKKEYWDDPEALVRIEGER